MGVDFSRTISLGRPHMLLTRAEAKKLLKSYGFPHGHEDVEAICSEKYADRFFSVIGCKDLTFLDYSDFEGAAILHDLNLPIGREHWNSYSCVVEGGTIEHIFNFPTVIDNCMKMTAVSGHFLSANQTNNWVGHGFYQFSPELFFNTFCEKNGFKTKNVFIAAHHTDWWYDMPDPAVLEQRVEVVSNTRTDIYTIAQRMSEQAGVISIPQQSFYEKHWREGDDAESIKARLGGKVSGSKAKIKERLASIIGVDALHFVQRLYELWNVRRNFVKHCPKVRPLMR